MKSQQLNRLMKSLIGLGMLGVVQLLLAQGPVVLDPPTIFPFDSTLPPVQQVEVADFNGDGFDDIAVTQFYPYQGWRDTTSGLLVEDPGYYLTVYLSKGATVPGGQPNWEKKTFALLDKTLLQEIADSKTPQGAYLQSSFVRGGRLIVADLNKDGFSDLIATIPLTGEIAVIWNQRGRTSPKWNLGDPIFEYLPPKVKDGSASKAMLFEAPLVSYQGGNLVAKPGVFGRGILGDCAVADLNNDRSNDIVCFIGADTPGENSTPATSLYQAFGVVLGRFVSGIGNFPNYLPNPSAQMYPPFAAPAAGMPPDPGYEGQISLFAQGVTGRDLPTGVVPGTVAYPRAGGNYMYPQVSKGLKGGYQGRSQIRPEWGDNMPIIHPTGKLFQVLADSNVGDTVFFEGQNGQLYQLKYNETTRWIETVRILNLSQAGNHLNGTPIGLGKTSAGVATLFGAASLYYNPGTATAIEQKLSLSAPYLQPCALGGLVKPVQFDAGLVLLTAYNYRRIGDCQSPLEAWKALGEANFYNTLKPFDRNPIQGQQSLLLLESLKEAGSPVRFTGIHEGSALTNVRAVPMEASGYHDLSVNVLTLGAAQQKALALLENPPGKPWESQLTLYWERGGAAGNPIDLLGAYSLTNQEMGETSYSNKLPQGEDTILISISEAQHKLEPLRYAVLYQAGVPQKFLTVALQSVSAGIATYYVKGLANFPPGDYNLSLWNSSKESNKLAVSVVVAPKPTITSLDPLAGDVCGIMLDAEKTGLYPKQFDVSFAQALPVGVALSVAFRNLKDASKTLKVAATDITISSDGKQATVKIPSTLTEGEYSLYVQQNGVWVALGRFNTVLNKSWLVNRQDSCQKQLPVFNDQHPGFCDDSTLYLNKAPNFAGELVSSGSLNFFGSGFQVKRLVRNGVDTIDTVQDRPLIQSAALVQGSTVLWADRSDKTITAFDEDEKNLIYGVSIHFGDLDKLLAEGSLVDLKLYSVPSAEAKKAGTPPVHQWLGWRTTKKGSCKPLPIEITELWDMDQKEPLKSLLPGGLIRLEVSKNAAYPGPDTLVTSFSHEGKTYALGPAYRSDAWLKQRVTNDSKVYVYVQLPIGLEGYELKSTPMKEVEVSQAISLKQFPAVRLPPVYGPGGAIPYRNPGTPGNDNGIPPLRIVPGSPDGIRFGTMVPGNPTFYGPGRINPLGASMGDPYRVGTSSMAKGLPPRAVGWNEKDSSGKRLYSGVTFVFYQGGEWTYYDPPQLGVFMVSVDKLVDDNYIKFEIQRFLEERIRTTALFIGDAIAAKCRGVHMPKNLGENFLWQNLPENAGRCAYIVYINKGNPNAQQNPMTMVELFVTEYGYMFDQADIGTDGWVDCVTVPDIIVPVIPSASLLGGSSFYFYARNAIFWTRANGNLYHVAKGRTRYDLPRNQPGLIPKSVLDLNKPLKCNEDISHSGERHWPTGQTTLRFPDPSLIFVDNFHH